jgi:7-cyano-7-deazaguanine reductase
MPKTENPLGKHIASPLSYSPSVLHAIERSDYRDSVGIGTNLPFKGEDVWTCYELSWLNETGMPRVAALSIRVPCTSTRLVESKSLKLYLNSFSQEVMGSDIPISDIIRDDLDRLLDTQVQVTLWNLQDIPPADTNFPGICLDDSSLQISHYTRAPELLAGQRTNTNVVEETLHTHLFRSLCPITAQPDFASLMLTYTGVPIAHGALLEYLISYRNHAAFHESTVEQIYLDIMQYCQPSALSVFARFTRRGGIDINPYRSSSITRAPEGRLSRQ